MNVSTCMKSGFATVAMIAPYCFALPALSAPAIFVPDGHILTYSIEGSNPGATRGWEFNVSHPGGVIVTRLSLFDGPGNGLGLGQAHDVALWDSNGVTLTAATIPAGTGAPLDANNQFRMVDIEDIFLPRANGYVIGAQYFNVGFGPDADDRIRSGSIQISPPSIEYVRRRFRLSTSSPTFPTAIAGDFGTFGPSFELVTVPEPGTLLLVASSLGPLFIWRRAYRSDTTLDSCVRALTAATRS